jgi:hypothetical protein
MGGWTLALPAALVVCVSVLALTVAGRTMRPSLATTDGTDPAQVTALARVRGRTVAWRLAGLGAGGAAAIGLATLPSESLGLGLALAPPTFALCLLGGVIMGEVFVRVPVGPTRTASLEVRSARAFLPPVMAWWVGGIGSVLFGFLLVTTILGVPDDMGRDGRAIAVPCGPDVVAQAGPWPGVFYSLPIGGAVLLGLALAALAARVVAGRPRPQVEESGRIVDDHLRRASGRTIVAAVGVLVAAPLAGSAAFAGAALETVGCGSTALRLVGLACIGLAVVAVIAAAAFVATVLLPADRADR